MSGVEQEREADAFEAEDFLNSASEIVELFDLFAASLGFTGRSILEGLASGEPLAAVVDIPDELLELLYYRAHLWGKVGDFQRAEQIFHVLCMANSRDPDYWAGFGLCLTRRGAWDRALEAYERALTLKPDWGTMHVYCLQSCVHMKAWERALEHSQRARELSVDIPEDLLELAARYHNLLTDHASYVTRGNAGA